MKMSDYPDPDEEFELMYGDELELLREKDIDEHQPPVKCRKSLDFSTPSSHRGNKNTTGITNLENSQQSLSLFESDFPSLSSQTDVQQLDKQIEPSNSKKRTVDELFGDITDIADDFFDDQPTAKKQKGDKLVEDLALIERIIQLRKLSKEKHSITVSVNTSSVMSRERDKHNISYRVPKYPFIGITRFDNERVYIRFHSEEYEKEEMERVIKECSFNSVMGDSFKDVWRDAQALINTQLDMIIEDSETNTDISIIPQTDETTQLWVDLYKPRKYLELLSDESTNRIMLRWIKLWDKVVYNRKPKIKPMKTEEPNKKNFFRYQELRTELDEYGRPQHKVALLCGPPGLGKTTLAHMVAKHAGYNVIEINASDDRTPEAFKASLENATQMRSVVDQERRPNCLVFDEIDGAPQSSIDYLVKFVNGTATTKPKKGKNQKQFILKRPIICICNDVYVPALRPLRQIAFVVNFPPTTSARLAERLMEIARRQQIKTDVGAMLALAEKSNNDIRSCLSVLHFFKVQDKPVTLSDIYRSSVGQKDMQKGLFAVWRDIFQIGRSKPVAGSTDTAHQESLKFRMAKILQVVSSFGDYERVAQGVFENYPLLKLKDSSLEGLCQSLEWFVFSDVINKEIYSLQNYSLTPYLQYAFVVWHFVFATTQNQKLNYPSAGYEAKVKETRRKALVSEVLRGMQPSVRVYCQTLSLILDIIPLLIRIITPQFRPVSLHLYTKSEKENMLKVVNIMIDYNLNYIQERTLEGSYSYNLEPNIEELVTFSDTDLPRRRPLSYFNKQLIAREIEMEKMRRFETPRVAETSEKKAVAPEKNKVAQLPNHLQTLKAKSMKTVKSTVTKDFFGRVISKPVPSPGKIGPNMRNDIWYQYKEGYSNAVRKRITISSLK